MRDWSLNLIHQQLMTEAPRPLQLPLEPAVLRLELLHAWVDRARRWSPAAPAHLPQGARLALPPPVRQQRRVQVLAAQQRAHLTGLPAGIRFLEDAEPILRGEAPPLGVGGELLISPAIR